MLIRLFLASVLVISIAFAEGSDYVAILKKPKNDVSIHRLDTELEINEDAEYIFKGDIIETGSNSSATLIFNDGTIVSLDAKSLLKIDDYLFKPSQKQYKFDIFLKNGVATYESGKMGKVAPEKISFNVPEGTIAVRGTRFLVEVK